MTFLVHRNAACVSTITILLHGGALWAAGLDAHTSARPYEVRQMRVGSYVAASPVRDDRATGGFGGSNNLPRELSNDIRYAPDRLQLIAYPGGIEPMGRGRGMQLLLINSTSEPAALRGVDSRLEIVQEAKDERGLWRQIEAIPTSWCGNSYHRVILPADHYWKFRAASYDGGFETTLRFRLSGIEGGDRIYSNEFAGRINLAQFTPPGEAEDGQRDGSGDVRVLVLP